MHSICTADVHAYPQIAGFDVLVVCRRVVSSEVRDDECTDAATYTRITSHHDADHGGDKDETIIERHK